MVVPGPRGVSFVSSSIRAAAARLMRTSFVIAGLVPRLSGLGGTSTRMLAGSLSPSCLPLADKLPKVGERAGVRGRSLGRIANSEPSPCPSPSGRGDDGGALPQNCSSLSRRARRRCLFNAIAPNQSPKILSRTEVGLSRQSIVKQARAARWIPGIAAARRSEDDDCGGWKPRTRQRFRFA